MILSDFMQKLSALYDRFLSLFPPEWHTVVSIAIIVLLVWWLLKLIKHNLIFIILLVIFVPASIPILVQIVNALIDFINRIIAR
ncbi:MAG: hypothetical protein HY459_03920 [Parcubacteria group bacterium]|nr:hypothetical protein [Parcubacteria group bacterium]